MPMAYLTRLQCVAIPNGVLVLHYKFKWGQGHACYTFYKDAKSLGTLTTATNGFQFTPFGVYGMREQQLLCYWLYENVRNEPGKYIKVIVDNSKNSRKGPG